MSDDYFAMSEYVIELNSSEMDVWRKQVEEELASRQVGVCAFLGAKEKVWDYEVGEELVRDGVGYYVSHIFMAGGEVCYELRGIEFNNVWGGGSTPESIVNKLFCRTGNKVDMGLPFLLKEVIEEQTPKEDCGYVRAEDVNGDDAMDILRSLL